MKFTEFRGYYIDWIERRRAYVIRTIKGYTFDYTFDSIEQAKEYILNQLIRER